MSFTDPWRCKLPNGAKGISLPTQSQLLYQLINDSKQSEMVGKEKPLNKVNRSDSLMVDTSSVIVKQEQSLLSPQSTSSEHSSIDQPPSAQSFSSICEDKAIIKYEDDSNNENTSSNDKPDRWVLTFIHSIVFLREKCCFLLSNRRA